MPYKVWIKFGDTRIKIETWEQLQATIRLAPPDYDIEH